MLIWEIKELNREKYLGTYSSYINSPLYHGKLQFDLWDAQPSDDMLDKWNKLKDDIIRHINNNNK